MTRSKLLNLQPYLIAIPFLMILLIAGISRSIYISESGMPQAILIDLLVVIPFVYFLVIRNREIPNITVVPFSIACLYLAAYLLPESEQELISQLKPIWISIAETGVVAFVIWNIIKIRRFYSQHNNPNIETRTMILNAVNEVIPGLPGTLIATEFLSFYYTFIAWKKPARPDNKAGEFSVHRQSQSAPLYVIILFILVAETFILHILLAHWSNTVAWILTLTSVYAFFQVTGMLSSIRQNLIKLKEDSLMIAYGIAAECPVAYSNIDEIHTYSLEPESLIAKGVRMTFLGNIEPVNATIELKEEVDVTLIYGRRKKSRIIHFYVDDPADFKASLEARITR